MDGFDSGYMLDDERNRLGQDQARLADQELIRDLRDLLGAKLVAYIASVKETRTVGQWAEGKRTPSAQVMQRLRTAHDVAAVIGTKDSRAVVQAWFQGMNPHLNDVSPARLLREGPPNEARRAALAAARVFAAPG